MIKGNTNIQPARAFLLSREAIFFFLTLFFISTLLVIVTSPFLCDYDVSVSTYSIVNAVNEYLDCIVVEVKNKGSSVLKLFIYNRVDRYCILVEFGLSNFLLNLFLYDLLSLKEVGVVLCKCLNSIVENLDLAINVSLESGVGSFKSSYESLELISDLCGKYVVGFFNKRI